MILSYTLSPPFLDYHTVRKHTAGRTTGSPQFAPLKVGASEDRTPLRTHPQCSPFQSAESGGRWQWTSLFSQHQHCNGTEKLFTAFPQPPTHQQLMKSHETSKMLSIISAAQLLKTSAAETGGSYHHLKGGRTRFCPSQPCICTRLHIKALEKANLSVQFAV